MPDTRIPEFTEDLNIIQALGDTPGVDNNLSPQELKAKFDSAPNLLKSYINQYVVTAINNYIAGDDGLLKLIGGTMEGILNMGGFALQNLPAPVQENDAARKAYVDSENTRYLETGKKYANSAIKTSINAAEKAAQVTLTVEGWTEAREQEVSVAGVTANNIVLYSTDPSTRTAYMESDVYLLSQSAGKLKFKWAESKPEVPLTVNVIVRVGVL